MKIRAITLKIDDESKINNDAIGFLEVGEEYFVSSIFIDIESNFVYYEINDPFKFLSWPKEMFEIVNNTVPSIWKVKVFENGNILIGPELFFEEFFFDRFSDQYDYETQEYEKIRPLLEI